MAKDDGRWLDEQYDNRARVPTHPQIFDRWARASALVVERSPRRLDIAYGDRPGERLDVFPSTRRSSPVLVFIHGGWWRSLDKRDHSFVAPVFADAGATVVVPNYDLCPAVPIETIALQMTRALAWTFRHAALYGGDPRRIVVAGHSAGGHLAAMLLACDWPRVAPDLPPAMVTRGLAISGVFDLDPIRRTPFLQPDLRLTPASAARLSPVRFPAPPAARLLLAVGERESEEFHRQSRALREAWPSSVPDEPIVVAGADHFEVLTRLVDGRSPLHRATLDLLDLR